MVKNKQSNLIASVKMQNIGVINKYTINHKAHISRNLIPDSIFISSVTFSAHFLYGPLQQIKKQLTVTLKFRNERLSKYYRQNTNVTI